MKPSDVLCALIDVAAKANIEVRVERFELALAGKGGLCRIAGRHVLLVDAKLSPLDQAGVVGQALGMLELDLDALDVPRSVRAYIETGHAEVKSLLRPRPLARVRE